MNTGKYIVVNEDTLACRQNGTFLCGVLAAKPAPGGYTLPYDQICVTPRDAVRDATLADFLFFRVSPVGHIA